MAPLSWLLVAQAFALSDALTVPSSSLGWTRRSAIGGLVATGFVRAAVAEDEDAPAELSPPLPPPPPAPTSISYVDIQKLLNDCRDGDACALEKVVFTVESGETGDAVFKSGARLPITGIPEDNPTNDSSPYKLVAKLRDAKVPYTFPFSEGLAKYRSKSNAEKTAPNQISAPFLALPKLPF